MDTQVLIAQYLAYIQTFWIERVGPDRLSVALSTNRTNNFVESWHHMLSCTMMGSHLNFWDFLSQCPTIFLMHSYFYVYFF